MVKKTRKVKHVARKSTTRKSTTSKRTVVHRKSRRPGSGGVTTPLDRIHTLL